MAVFPDTDAGQVNLDDLGEYLELPLDCSIISERKTGVRTKDKEELSALDKLLLRGAVEPVAGQLGYRS